MKIFSLKILFIAALLSATTCLADTWISVGGGTEHFCHTCGYNNFNPGLGVQHDYNADVKLIAGGYYNSFHKTSLYGGAAYQPLQYSIIKFGVVSGLVSNYNNLRVPVMVLPALSIEGERVGVDILGGPSVGNYKGLVTANLKFKL
jgi:hypothetical protein